MSLRASMCMFMHGMFLTLHYYTCGKSTASGFHTTKSVVQASTPHNFVFYLPVSKAYCIYRLGQCSLGLLGHCRLGVHGTKLGSYHPFCRPGKEPGSLGKNEGSQISSCYGLAVTCRLLICVDSCYGILSNCQV